MTPNLSEFESVAGACGSDSELARKGEALRAHLELDALLITLGERGMLLLRRRQAALHLPTRAQEVFDVTGAGDTVIAVLAVAMAAGAAANEPRIRLSVKFILNASGNRPPTGEFNTDAEVQAQIGRDLVLKYTPVLAFHLDDSIEKGNRVLEILEELEQNDADSAGR